VAVKVIDVGLKFNGALSKRAKTDYIILHHAAATHGTVQAIHNYHVNGRGWKGIGYNFYVRKDGSIYQGRPEWAVGAHATGYNDKSIGVCAEGNFEAEKMPEAQKQAIIELVRELKQKYPNAQIKRHKDFAATSCPGKNYPFDEIAQAINKKEGDNVAAMRKGDKGSAVKKLQQDLMTLGYSLAPYGADSSFGRVTEEAVKKFQKDNKLAVDGIVGPATQKKIEELLKAKSSKPASDYKKMYEEMKAKYEAAQSKLNQIKKILG